MPYYSHPPHSVYQPNQAYPANQGDTTSEEYDSPFEPGPHVNHAILNDADFMAQELSTVRYSDSFYTEPYQTIKIEPDPDPACLEFQSLLLSLESSRGISGLKMDSIEHAPIRPTPLLSNPFSSESGLDMMGKTGSYGLGEVDLDQQLYRTSYQTLEKDEQDFSNTAGAMRMMQTTLIPDASRFQSPIGDQQLDGIKDKDYDSDEDEGDNGTLLMIKDQMESEEEGEGMMGNQEEGMKFQGERVEEEEQEEEQEEEGMMNNQEGAEEAKEGDAEAEAEAEVVVNDEPIEPIEPIYLLRQRLPEQRIRSPEPNWEPYRPSNGTLASMRNYVQALGNKLLLSRAGWSEKLLEDLFGSPQLPPSPGPPPPPPPPTSNWKKRKVLFFSGKMCGGKRLALVLLFFFFLIGFCFFGLRNVFVAGLF